MKYHNGIEWYENHFKKNKINGEKTPNYMNDTTYIDRIKKHYPNVKIVIILRNPVTRALSHWNHFNQIYEEQSKNWGWKYTTKFKESILLNETILFNGLYYNKIKYVFETFKKENVKIIINEKFRNNPNKEFNKLCNFLNIDNVNLIIKDAHTRKYDNEIYVDEIKYLIEYYKNDCRKLYNLLGYKVTEWEEYNNIFKKKNNKSIINPAINAITPIIICVNYSDILKYTIKENIKVLKNITVVSDTKDVNTHKLCEDYNIKCLKTDIFYDKEKPKLNSFFDLFKTDWWFNVYQFIFNTDKNKLFPSTYFFSIFKKKWWYDIYNYVFDTKKIFNKAKAVNYAIKKTNTDWVLLLDADIIIPQQLSLISLNSLNKNYLYGTHRFIYKTKNDWLEKKNCTLDFWKFVGFFQLFNKTSTTFTKNYYGYDEQYNFANSSDYFFMKKWKNNEKKLLNFPVIHLGETEINWKGRISDLW